MTDPSVRLTAALSDRYRIERELGAGRMATVYLAQDVKHQRKIAINVLHPELAAAETALAVSDRHVWSLAGLGAEYGRAGDRGAAEAIYAELVERARTRYVQPTWLAIASVGCQRMEEALAYLLRAALERDALLPVAVKYWPIDLNALRELPGYREVQRRMGWE